ncbi:MAG: assimilatory sulfite reductase (NADPH) flavoprotein subunit [Planctomycetota bacterium]
MSGFSFRVDKSPFNQHQVEVLNQLLATLSPDQVIWLSGYLAGMQGSAVGGNLGQVAVSSASSPASGTPIVTAIEREVTILFGSQTGNAERLAGEMKKQLEEAGFSVTLSCMSEFRTNNLKKIKQLLILVSTYGEGDPPDKAVLFHEFLQGKRAPRLEGVRFSILSLGDQLYDQFCKTGQDFDARLEELGAKRIHPRVDCDVDFDEPAKAWMNGVLNALSSEGVAPAKTGEGGEVIERIAAGVVSAGATSGAAIAAQTVAAPAFTRTNPFTAEVLENFNLNGRGSEKETRHLKLAIEGSGLCFEPGDSLGIYPHNDPQLVDEVLSTLGWNGDETIPVGKQELPLREALIRHYEITLLSKQLLTQAASFAQGGLQNLVQADANEKLKAYTRGRDLLDLVRDFSIKGIPPREFVPLLRKLPARLYSIASSFRANSGEVDLCIAALRYQAHNRDRLGTCSVHCAERVESGDYLQVFVHSNPNFRQPADPDAPIIMVGPGTGVAPFRAFVEDREESGAGGKSWLFFGDRHFRTDFLYQVEWLRWLKLGMLTRLEVAFSRDQGAKVYVQHRMLEKSRELFGWLQDGAHFYVCGSINPMAADVHAALVNIVEREGGKSKEEAEAYVAGLREQGRYQRDVY